MAAVASCKVDEEPTESQRGTEAGRMQQKNKSHFSLAKKNILKIGRRRLRYQKIISCFCLVFSRGRQMDRASL